ncbi:MAG: hypothetical protein BMS9Abin31_0365 [Gammaproteobacteria bacterium]|nr:MAG: hypothetical protein BMS9Abin31_0365 [Gammaproteobacteria bacterium]
MNSITVYIDESLTTREIVKLKHEILAIPHVLDVEHPRHDPHDLTIDYEAHESLPGLVLEKLRSQGLHPDIISA